MDQQGFVEIPDYTLATVFRTARPLPEHVATLDLEAVYTKYAIALDVPALTNEQKSQALLGAIVEALADG